MRRLYREVHTLDDRRSRRGWKERDGVADGRLSRDAGEGGKVFTASIGCGGSMFFEARVVDAPRGGRTGKV
jgi:hypothetical protein